MPIYILHIINVLLIAAREAHEFSGRLIWETKLVKLYTYHVAQKLRSTGIKLKSNFQFNLAQETLHSTCVEKTTVKQWMHPSDNIINNISPI